MKNIIYTLSILFVLSGNLFGQSKKAFEEAANKAFIEENYFSALTYYNNLLEFDEKDAYNVYRSAESARLFNSYELAAKRYTYLIDTLENIPDPSVYFYAGQMYHRIGKLDKANEFYDLYLSQYGKEGEVITNLAKKEKKSLEWASSRLEQKSPDVVITHMGGEINGVGSDFGASMENGKLVFTSQRFDSNSKSLPAPKISKLLTDEKGAVSELKGDFNITNKSVANHVFSLDKSKIYYTICDYIKEDVLKCEMFWSKVNDDGTYGDAQKIPSPLNDTLYTNTQPSFGIDPSTGTEVLYFVSDRPGGKGKLDIWYSYYDKNLGFSNPINAADINTNENDITPFFHIPSNVLYFSSDGRSAFGGYDIFSTTIKKDKFQEVEILPAPFNTTYHDVYYRLDDKGEEGYLSSNREGSVFVDEVLKACCYDIFKVNIAPVVLNLNALTYDKKTGVDLVNAKVKLIDKKTGKVIKEVVNNFENSHLFPLEKNMEYMVVGEKEGFKPDTVYFDTYNRKKSEDIIQKLYLETDKLELDVFTFDENTKASLVGAKVTIEDLTDPDNPVMVQVNEISNNFNFSLDKNKSYRITATKNGYQSATVDIDTRNAVGKISKNLYLRKTDINRLLPLSLYFDNDEPDQDSKSTSTDKTYGALAEAYMMRKPTFLENYTKGVKNDADASYNNMDIFFEGDIRGGLDRFRLFMDELLKALNEGQKIEMTIRGYASPRFDERYNLVLGQRRINSVRNEMLKYNNEALASYLINEQLLMTEISYGEELSPTGTVDNINDLKGSIYSLKASKERRVEVISVKIK
jgi:outer membrane protein OmpA-like peptidoglycan-associated protein/tetratricopeptide (TPR) repeat protein